MAAERAAMAEQAAEWRDAQRTRRDNEIYWLRAALAELLACHTEAEGWTASMLADRAEFDAMLTRSQDRLKRAVDAARVALGPNVANNRIPTAHDD